MALIKINNRSSVDTVKLGRRNLIINGSMQVAQRGTSATGILDDGYYTTDRWQYQAVGTNTATVDLSQETSDAPTGFNYYHRATVNTAATTINADEAFTLKQLTEKINSKHILFGTSDAKDLTLSFWVRSNITGTFCMVFRFTGPNTQSYTVEYTIDSADTWEKKIINIPAITTGGVSTGDDNLEYFQIRFMLATGSSNYSSSTDTWNIENKWGTANQTNFFATSGNTFDLTGVQLEIGNEPSEFEHISYPEELQLCRRYFISTNSDNLNDNQNSSYYITGTWYNGRGRFAYDHPVQMRTKPSGTVVDADGNGTVAVWAGATRIDYTGNWTFENSSVGSSYYMDNYSSSYNGQAILGYIGNAGANDHYLELNAEL